MTVTDLIVNINHELLGYSWNAFAWRTSDVRGDAVPDAADRPTAGDAAGPGMIVLHKRSSLVAHIGQVADCAMAARFFATAAPCRRERPA
jgi:hypothetical protein